MQSYRSSDEGDGGRAAVDIDQPKEFAIHRNAGFDEAGVFVPIHFDLFLVRFSKLQPDYSFWT